MNTQEIVEYAHSKNFVLSNSYSWGELDGFNITILIGKDEYTTWLHIDTSVDQIKAEIDNLELRLKAANLKPKNLKKSKKVA